MFKSRYGNGIRLTALFFSLVSGLYLAPWAAAQMTNASTFADLKSWTFQAKSEDPENFLRAQDSGKLELVLKLGPHKQWAVDPNADFKDVGVEAIGFNFRERTIYPLYPADYTISLHPTRIIDSNRRYKDGLSPCHDDVDEYGYAKTDLATKRLMGYSPCSSSLTKNYVTMAVNGSLSHAIDSFMGSFMQHPARNYVVVVNPEAVTAAVTSAGALDAAIQMVKDHEQADLATAMNSADLRRVIQNYQNLDLIGQMPDAIAREQALHLSEYRDDYAAAASSNTSEGWRLFGIKYSNFDPDSHLETTQATYLRMVAEENNARARAQDDKKARAAEALSAWRRSLVIGTHTHCGPVLDKRGTLVQVYAPVANYGNEHWVELNDLYPEGNKSCYFSNGHLVTN